MHRPDNLAFIDWACVVDLNTGISGGMRSIKCVRVNSINTSVERLSHFGSQLHIRTACKHTQRMDACLERLRSSVENDFHVRCERSTVEAAYVDAPWNVSRIRNCCERSLFEEGEKATLSHGRYQRLAVGRCGVDRSKCLLFVFAVGLNYHRKNPTLFTAKYLLDSSAHRRQKFNCWIFLAVKKRRTGFHRGAFFDFKFGDDALVIGRLNGVQWSG